MKLRLRKRSTHAFLLLHAAGLTSAPSKFLSIFIEYSILTVLKDSFTSIKIYSNLRPQHPNFFPVLTTLHIEIPFRMKDLSYDPYGPARAFIAKLLRKSPYEGRTRVKLSTFKRFVSLMSLNPKKIRETFFYA